MTDTAEQILTEFTDRCWDYDAMCCAICNGYSILGVEWDDPRRSGDHDDFIFSHYPTCLWVRAHRVLGRDLGPHTVEDA